MAIVIPGDAWSAIAALMIESSSPGSAGLIPAASSALTGGAGVGRGRGQPASARSATAAKGAKARVRVMGSAAGSRSAAAGFLARGSPRTYSCDASSIKRVAPCLSPRRGAPHTPTLMLRSTIRRPLAMAAIAVAAAVPAISRAQQLPSAPAGTILLRPARVFDGTDVHDGWTVLVRGEKIERAGPAAQVVAPSDARIIDLPGATLLPGLIDAHSHVLLHPYNETAWNDQVLHEPLALRVARATNHLHATLDAGFTTLRDLGTEGAADADVGLKQAVNQGIVPGPRLIVVTRAIVATGSYGPKG